MSSKQEVRAKGRGRGRARGQVVTEPSPGVAPGPATPQPLAPIPGIVAHPKASAPTVEALPRDSVAQHPSGQTAAPLQAESMRPLGRARGRARGQPPTDVTEAQPMPGAVGGSRAAYRGAETIGKFRQAHKDLVATASQAMGAVRIEDSGDNGNGESSVGRGVLRGRRVISNIVWSKPLNITEKRGMAGQAVKLLANYFTVVKKLDWKLCLYHVDFSPEEDRTSLRKKMLRQHTQALGNNYIFDGMQLYLPYKLGNEVTELASKREEDDTVYQVKIKFIKQLESLDSQYMQIMGIILRKCLDLLGLQLIGRNYYNPSAQAKDEKYKIVIWPGFSTNIRQHEQSLLLNADVVHKFLRADTAYDIMRSCGRNVRSEATKHLLGCVVMTVYNDRTYRIDDIAWNVNPESKFPFKGGEITYIEYYQTYHHTRIKDSKQPMLLSKPKKRDLRRGNGVIYLVPELCIMTGISDAMRSDFNMMKDLSQYMRMNPDRRVAALLRFNRDMNSHAEVQTELKNWGLQLSNGLVQVQGRLLPGEHIMQGGQSLSYDRRSSDWSRETRSTKMNVSVELRDWAMIFPARYANDARELFNTLRHVGPPLGMSIGQPATKSLRGESIQEFISVMNDLAGKQLVMCVLPGDALDRYSAIKRHLTIKMGLPSQCVLAKTLFKKQRLMSVATKIAIQMNCKLGGEPWSIAVPLKNAMVIGYDTYHDKKTRGSSYGAVVSSLNQGWTRYFSQVAQHKNEEELSDNFTTGVKNALIRYIRNNGTSPNMVIVYRDGVGEGQIEHVKNHEIASIKQCFELTCSQTPKFAFIIVSKRTNNRLFLEDRGHVGNPLPGTVVDDVITLPERYDFYLTSQCVNQGTVSPTSYNVIEDTTGLRPDHMQRLAYKLTHIYYNWQGTVCVPAPCMYAHKLAYMTGQAVNGMAHPNLLDRLWYL